MLFTDSAASDPAAALRRPVAPLDATVRCTACLIPLTGSAARTAHYSSDLHRVNLKRKLANIAPLTADDFARRLAALHAAAPSPAASSHPRQHHPRRVPQKAAAAELDEGEAAARAALACGICVKRFASAAAKAQHTRSQRHAEAARRWVREHPGVAVPGAEQEAADAKAAAVAAAAAPEEVAYGMPEVREGEDGGVEEEEGEGDWEEETEEEAEARINAVLASRVPIPASTCVFDSRDCGSPDAALEYMNRRFGFFLPYREFLVDVPGLLAYLGEKVGVGHACVCCDRMFKTVHAVQDHMVAKGHCKMADDTVAAHARSRELGKEDGMDEAERQHAWMVEYEEFYDFGLEEEGDEDGKWEEVKGPEELGQLMKVADIDEAAQEPPRRAGPVSVRQDVDANKDAPMELRLANGASLGHRHYARYYRQNPRADESRSAVVASRAELGARPSSALVAMRGPGSVARPEHVATLRARQANARRSKHFDLHVGAKNYYTRKAGLKPSMGVMNSGYRP